MPFMGLKIIQIMKYFAYGSNLNISDLKKWCERRNEEMPILKNPKITKINNFMIGFTRKSISRAGGVADLVLSKGDFCYGVTFDATENDFEILDKKEGVNEDGTGAYERLELTNEIITYQVRIKNENFIQPSEKYLDVIIEGAKYHKLPNEWIKKLETFRN